MQKKWLGVGAAVLAVVLLVPVGGYAYLIGGGNAKLDEPFDLTGRAVPVPFPLTEAELGVLRDEALAARQQQLEVGEANPDAPEAPEPDAAEPDGAAEAGEMLDAPADEPDPLEGVDLDAVALERAIARGKHIVEARAGCGECHGADGSGKVIVDAIPMGTWAAPNLTAGRAQPLTLKQWDLAVRHGVAADGTRSTMPSEDYALWADRDLSDVIAYYQSLPAKPDHVPPTAIGPIFGMLAIQGQWAHSVDAIDHSAQQPLLPPEAAATVEFGAYMGQVCTGCHGPGLSGGAIPGGDPEWPEASNITPHASGTAGWDLATFDRAIRAGTGGDGRTLDQKAMPWPTFNKMTDVEVEALYLWTQSLEAKPYGGR